MTPEPVELTTSGYRNLLFSLPWQESESEDRVWYALSSDERLMYRLERWHDGVIRRFQSLELAKLAEPPAEVLTFEEQAFDDGGPV